MNKLAFLGFLLNPSLAYKCIMYAVNKCRSIKRRIQIMKKITQFKELARQIRDAISIAHELCSVFAQAIQVAKMCRKDLKSVKEEENNGK